MSSDKLTAEDNNFWRIGSWKMKRGNLSSLLVFSGLFGLLILGCTSAQTPEASVTDKTMVDANKAVVLKVVNEAINGHSIDLLRSILAEDYVRHSQASAPLEEITDRETFLNMVEDHFTAFPDWEEEIQWMIAEGDMVTYFTIGRGTHRGQMGPFAPTNKQVTAQNAVTHRIKDGRIVETWILWDNLALFNQLGLLPALGPEAAGSEEENKALVQAFSEAENARDYDTLDELLAENFTRHSSATPDFKITNREEFKEFLSANVAAFSDYSTSTEMMVAEGDKVAVYATITGTMDGPIGDIPATGNSFEAPFLAVFRIEDGLIAELWVEWDNVNFLSQLGLFPPPAPASDPATTQLSPEQQAVSAKQIAGDWAFSVMGTGEGAPAILTFNEDGTFKVVGDGGHLKGVRIEAAEFFFENGILNLVDEQCWDPVKGEFFQCVGTYEVFVSMTADGKPGALRFMAINDPYKDRNLSWNNKTLYPPVEDGG